MVSAQVLLAEEIIKQFPATQELLEEKEATEPDAVEVAAEVEVEAEAAGDAAEAAAASEEVDPPTPERYIVLVPYAVNEDVVKLPPPTVHRVTE